MLLVGSQDGNWGLVEIASRKRTMRAVQKLTQTYITFSLEGIAQAVELPSASHAEMLLLRCGPSPATRCLRWQDHSLIAFDGWCRAQRFVWSLM